ncbi:hypothetical protein SASPL_144231 [Salvia splendens]|uniref:Molecular chaperone HtpG n=1 Tax=Salvia splendens TaxID=180675 RepID=A0A8X8WLP5_SALSN|nr:hypothetical protein SASPL_144231 [Salvia splendens]
MAPALSRSLASAAMAVTPNMPSFSTTSNRGLLRSAFLPKTGLKNTLLRSGLEWKVEGRRSGVVVRCDASAIAEKEALESSGETFEYQAEVSRLMDLIVHSLYSHKEVFLRELVRNKLSATDEFDPIILDDIDECNEWLVGELDDDDDDIDGGYHLIHDDDDTLDWNMVYKASGVGEPRTYTRSKKRKESFTSSSSCLRVSKKKEPIIPRKGKGKRKRLALVDEESEEEEFEDSVSGDQEDEAMEDEDEMDADDSDDNELEDYIPCLEEFELSFNNFVLCSNASDALDKLRFLSVTEPALLGDSGDLEIRIKPDPDNGTITITDTGIGMTKEELIDCLGTIAQNQRQPERTTENSLVNQEPDNQRLNRIEEVQQTVIVVTDHNVDGDHSDQTCSELLMASEIIIDDDIKGVGYDMEQAAQVQALTVTILPREGPTDQEDRDKTIYNDDELIEIEHQSSKGRNGRLEDQQVSSFENQDLGADNSLIGQFGVGFYSAFLIANRVVVSTKSPWSDKQYVWESVADSSSYTIREETDPSKLISRGTQITLYLRDDDKYEYTEPTKIQSLVKNYSQFVSFPIYTWQEKSRTIEVEEEEEPKEGEEVSEGEKKKMRNPKEVEKEQYQEFYKKTFNEFLDPLTYTHFTTEGEVEFRSVLYIPGMAPLNNEEVINPKTKNIRLYVKRVFISDDFDGELFPRYLSFVKGVVDSDDLPLNVSRQILQESRIVRIMRKRLVRKTFDMIQDLSESESKEDYKKFWENFGKFLKLGCIEDTGNHKRITPLLRFLSSKSDEDLISLDDYIENMGENQKAIYYLATDSLKSAKSAPFVEKLIQKGIEVLYLIEPIDEVAIQNLETYKEKKFVDISKEDLELGDEDEVSERENKQEYNLLCDWIKQQLGEKVAKVQVSKRLASSPCVLVSGKFGWSANMERLMRAQTLGDQSSLEFMRGRRILEINPEHPVVKDLNAACKNAPDNVDAKRAVELLYDTALISSGFTPDSPAELSSKIYEMMAMALGGRWGRSEDDEEGEGYSNAASEAVESQVVEPEDGE